MELAEQRGWTRRIGSTLWPQQPDLIPTSSVVALTEARRSAFSTVHFSRCKVLVIEALQAMVLYVIGLGLYDEKDITVRYGLSEIVCILAVCSLVACTPSMLFRRGLEAVKQCSRVYLEAYTSVLMVPKERLVPPQR